MKSNVSISLLLFLALSTASCSSVVPLRQFSGSSIDGRYGIFGDRKQGRLELKEIVSGRVVKTWKASVFDSLQGSLTFTPDNHYLVLPMKNSIQFWNLKTGSIDKTLLADKDSESFLRITGNQAGTLLAASDMKGRIYIWDVDSGVCLRRLMFKEEFPVDFASELTISYDDKYLAAGTFGIIKVYEIGSGREFRRWTWLEEPVAVHSLAISSSGNLVAAGLGYDQIRVWDVKENELMWSVASENGKKSKINAYGIAFHPSELYVVALTAKLNKNKTLSDYVAIIRRSTSGELVSSRVIPNLVNICDDGRMFAWNPESPQVTTYMWGGDYIELMTGTALDKTIRDALSRISTEMSSRGWKRIAVCGSNPISTFSSPLDRYVTGEILSGIDHVQRFSVVERRLAKRAFAVVGVDTIASDLGVVNESFLSNPDLTKEFGQLTGADAITTCEVEDLLTSVRLTASLVGTETGERLLVADKYLDKDDTMRRLMNTRPVRVAAARPKPAERTRPGTRTLPAENKTLYNVLATVVILALCCVKAFAK